MRNEAELKEAYSVASDRWHDATTYAERDRLWVALDAAYDALMWTVPVTNNFDPGECYEDGTLVWPTR